MTTIKLKDQAGRMHSFECEQVIDGVPINPKLPPNFDSTPNERRPDRQRAWENVPFIRSYHGTDPQFIEHWGGTVRYDVRCLDGGAWDRSTWWGASGKIEEAVALAKNHVPYWMVPAA